MLHFNFLLEPLRGLEVKEGGNARTTIILSLCILFFILGTHLVISWLLFYYLNLSVHSFSAISYFLFIIIHRRSSI